jgi:hypothetical protein
MIYAIIARTKEKYNMNNELVQKIDNIVETLNDLRGHL